MTLRRLALPGDETPSERDEAVSHELGQRRDFERRIHDTDRRLLRATDGTTNIKLTVGTAQKLYHQLGHLPVGFRVIDRNASAVVWRTASDRTSITLQASATVTVKIEIF